MTKHPDLVVIGSFVQDHVWQTERFPVPGETRLGHGFSTGPGGKGFNQAIAAHRLGANVLFVAAIGKDALGDFAKTFAGNEGMTCRWQIVDDAPTAAAGIVVDDAGRNQIVVALGANDRLYPEHVDGVVDALASARLVLLQLETRIGAIDTVLELAQQHGVPVLLNPAPVHPALRRDQLDRIALLTPNETEFALLLERFADTHVDADQVAALDDETLHAHARRLGVATVVITLGAHGCFVSHADNARHRREEPSCYRVPVQPARTIDTTGAGDAFNGALAAALAGDPTTSFRDAIEHATRCAAVSTETLGAATAMPTAAQVRARFHQT